MKLFRERLLARLVERHAMSDELARKLVTWTHPHYANRVRGERPGETEPPDTARPSRRCSPSWARLIAKVFQADPLVCRRCGGPLKVVASITDALAIKPILEHLDLSLPEKLPPEIRDVVRVPVDDEGREIDLQPA